MINFKNKKYIVVRKAISKEMAAFLYDYFIMKRNVAKTLYEEIILSKNSFYSILSLNKIIEKNLIVDENKILDYFKILEKSPAAKENRDLIFLKKALYLIKISNTKAANEILKNLIEKNSYFKSVAQELIKK